MNSPLIKRAQLSAVLAAAVAACMAAPAAAAVEVEVDFTAPPGYTVRHDAAMVTLVPAAPERTPCVYGLSPPRPSKGSLEADAQAALAEVVVPGWQRASEWSHAAKGTVVAGWPWFRVQGDFRQGADAVSAMALVFPAGTGRVHLVWGLGNPARCTLDDTAFARLLHSLRPRGWQSDGGAALSRQLQGTWRNTERAGLSQFSFGADGRYQRALATATRLGPVGERTSSSVETGRYALREGALVLMPERGGAASYGVRVFEEFTYVRGRWTRVLGLIAPDSGAEEVRYDRVD